MCRLLYLCPNLSKHRIVSTITDQSYIVCFEQHILVMYTLIHLDIVNNNIIRCCNHTQSNGIVNSGDFEFMSNSGTVLELMYSAMRMFFSVKVLVFILSCYEKE